MPHLLDVLVKFRGFPVGIASDVEKAFHQIEIDPDDRRMLRFLWVDDITKEKPKIVHYQFCRLVFGLTPSPAILSSVMEHHLKEQSEEHQSVVSVLENSFYLDDFIGGAWDDSGAVEIYEKADEIMQNGGFKLRKWTSNSKVFPDRVALDRVKGPEESKDLKVLENGRDGNVKSNDQPPIQQEQHITKYDTANDDQKLEVTDSSTVREPPNQKDGRPEDEGDANSVKVLGVSWNVITDEFEYDLSKLFEYARTLPPTKPSVLKLSAMIFDPLRFLCAFTILLKTFFQSLCTDNVNWDDSLSGRVLKSWNRIMSDLSSLQPIRISRCYFAISNNPLVFELHGFSDASCKAHAAVVFLRTVYVYGGSDVRFMAAKSRVAPVKKQSIPRLELLGAVILARLVNCVRKAITSLPTVPKVMLWTDSYTVLCWIRNAKAWKTYVRNHVDEIRNLTKIEDWRFCPGEKNPADIPSRGCNASTLVECEMWWNGPMFLRLDEDHWPVEPNHDDKVDQQIKEELVKPKSQPEITRSLVNVKSRSILGLDKIIDCSRYCTKLKLLRVTAYVRRFVDMARRRVQYASNELIAEEIRQAEKLWLRSIQQSHFTEECGHLVGNSVKQPPPIIRQLGLFHDEENVVRCQGRIDKSSVPRTAKQPVLLPSRHRFTELVILERHASVHHNGIRDTLNSIREKYWTVQGCEVVKRVIWPCIVCKQIEGKPFGTPREPQLPLSRVSNAPPFANTGIDFAGPLHVSCKGRDQSNSTMEKAYVCLLTCASTCALHLELVPNLSVATFLQAFYPSIK